MVQHRQIQICEGVIKFSKEVKSPLEIASLLLISKSTMNNIIVKYHCGYGLKYCSCSGRPRKTSRKVDRIIKHK